MLILTGATGLVGGAFLRQALAVRPELEVTVLGRRPLAGVRSVRCDLREPLPEFDAGRVTEILHCAAETRFGLPIEQIRATNVGGTARLIGLARRCPRLEKFGYLSTVYVCGRTAGTIPEAPLRHANGFMNTYQQSKHEAEALVLESGLPATIFRMSSIIGDSRSGEVRQFNYTHQLLRLLPRNALPLAPAIPDAPVDLIACDWAIAALHHLFTRSFTPGRVYHLCAGFERSLTVREMIDLAIASFESHPGGRRWLPIRVPELVGLEEWEAFAESARNGEDRLLQELVRVLGYFLPHLAIRQVFDNGNALAGLEGSGLEMPLIRDYFGRMVHYCLDTNWGRA